MNNFLRSHRVLLILLGCYIALNLLTLTKYPKVHHDEGILANFAYLLQEEGLPIVHKNISGHGFFKGVNFSPFSGILFYGTLALVGRSLEFNLYSLRLHPFCFSLLSLILLYRISLSIFDDKRKAVLAVFFLATSTQFLAVAHVIRQESMFIANLLALYLLLLEGLRRQKTWPLLLSAFLSGASICIHPNGIFMPPLLFALFLSQHGNWKGPLFQIFLKMAGFFFLGVLLFFSLDYLPSKDNYWKLLGSPFFGGFTPHYFTKNSAGTLILNLLKAIWGSSWGTRYHQNMLYLFLDLTAIVGAFIFLTREHKFLLATIALLFLILLPTHANYQYFVYLAPFFSLLLGSVIVEWKRATLKPPYPVSLQKMARVAQMLLLIICLLHPVLTLWSFRNYSFQDQINKVRSIIDQKSRFIAASLYFFGFQGDNFYPDYALAGSDLKTLVEELNIKYIIVERFDQGWSSAEDLNGTLAESNRSFLAEQCQIEKSFREYRPNLVRPSEDGYAIAIYNCGRKGS